MRCAVIEADTREEVMQEMEERMHNMEKMYTRRLMKEIEQNEAKMDAKIDMIQRAGGLPLQGSSSLEETLEDIEEEDEIESTLDRSRMHKPMDENHDSDFSPSRSPSPLAAKSLRKQQHKSDESSQETEDAGEPEEEEAEEGADVEPSSELDSEPDLALKPKRNVIDSPHSRPSGSHVLVPPSPIFEADVKAAKLMNSRSQPPKRGSSLTAILEKTRSLSLADDGGDARESIVIIPNKKARAETAARGGPGVEYVPGAGEVDVAKKKKR